MCLLCVAEGLFWFVCHALRINNEQVKMGQQVSEQAFLMNQFLTTEGDQGPTFRTLVNEDSGLWV